MELMERRIKYLFVFAAAASILLSAAPAGAQLPPRPEAKQIPKNAPVKQLHLYQCRAINAAKQSFLSGNNHTTKATAEAEALKLCAIGVPGTESRYCVIVSCTQS